MTTQLRWLAGLVLCLASASAFAPDFSVLLGGTGELQRQLEREAAKSARAAQAFGASLSAADRGELQGACTAIADDPNDAAAQGRLASVMSRHRDRSAEAIVRFCLDPVIVKLRDELRASRLELERLDTGRGAQANAALDGRVQRQRQVFTTISNVMKTKHDTVKNSISNVR